MIMKFIAKVKPHQRGQPIGHIFEPTFLPQKVLSKNLAQRTYPLCFCKTPNFPGFRRRIASVRALFCMQEALFLCKKMMNTYSNYLLEVEGLNWLQNHIASDTFTNMDADKLLGLYFTDDVQDPETGEITYTLKVPTMHIENTCIQDEDSIRIQCVCPSPVSIPASAPASVDSEKNENEVNKKSTVSNQHSEHNYQFGVTDNLDIAPSVSIKNTYSNYLLEVEEGLNWLQNHIASDTLTNMDADKLLGALTHDNQVI